MFWGWKRVSTGTRCETSARRSTSDSFGTGPVERERVVEGAAARLHHHRHPLDLGPLGRCLVERREPVVGRVEAAAVGRRLRPQVRAAHVLDRAALGEGLVERDPAGDHLRQARGSRRRSRPGACRATSCRAASRGSCPGACACRDSRRGARRCGRWSRSGPARRRGRRSASRCRSAASRRRGRGPASSSPRRGRCRWRSRRRRARRSARAGSRPPASGRAPPR